ncbi:MAG: FAD-binding oxidoreductase [Rhizobiales bacterium]|nr:FAD-binding oxidoreductase [Hyphomicrobiales bacterium]
MTKPENQNQSLDGELLAQFVSLVGEPYALFQEEDKRKFLVEWRDKYVGSSPLVLLPGSVEEVSAIVKLAAETKTALVPQGGNTGLVGGQIPDHQNRQIVVSLNRMNKVRSISPLSNSMVVDAGVTLLEAQQEALSNDRLFPLSLASEGSCQIGGNISSNAGGIQVLKYGMMRDLVLGLEVVLPSGEIWHGLTDLRKDNTGYDLKHLFMGAEGTLGIITAATLKLFPKPLERQVGFVGCTSLEQLSEFFNFVSGETGSFLSAFEMICRTGVEFVLKHGSQSQEPLDAVFPWYGLIELESTKEGLLGGFLEDVLGRALERGFIEDGVISSSEAQRKNLWALREEMSEMQKPEGGSIKHDVSVPVAAIPQFIKQGNELVERMIPGARPVPFGHFGDGNIHYNISQPVDMDKQAFLEQWEPLSNAVYDLVLEFGGSISAEHGIGVMKRDLLAEKKSSVEMNLMRTIKQSLDPDNIMNPGKVF